jgi:hypothetical protein
MGCGVRRRAIVPVRTESVDDGMGVVRIEKTASGSLNKYGRWMRK